MVTSNQRVATQLEPGGVCEPIGLLLTVRLNQLFPSWFGLGVCGEWACHLADDLARKVVVWWKAMFSYSPAINKDKNRENIKYWPDRMDQPDTDRVV